MMMGYKALANVTARNMIITLKQVEFGRQKFAELLLLLLLLFVVNNSKEQIRFTFSFIIIKNSFSFTVLNSIYQNWINKFSSIYK